MERTRFLSSALQFRFTGWDVMAPNIVYAPVRISDDERAAALNAWSVRLRSIETEHPIDVGQY